MGGGKTSLLWGWEGLLELRSYFAKIKNLIGEGKLMRYRRYVKKEGLWEYSIKGKQLYGLW